MYRELRGAERRSLIDDYREFLGIKDAETAPEYEDIAEQLISKLPDLALITDLNVQIGYVKSFEAKVKDGRTVFGDCRKVSTIYGAYLPFDFIITLYEPNIISLTVNQLKLLIYHELLHIGINDRGLCVKPHDVEDFDSIINKYGLHWINADVPDIMLD
jgi:predicted metallopeptidase